MDPFSNYTIELMTAESNQVRPHQWVESYADYLYAYTVACISDEEQAKDLVQEIVLTALEKGDKFEGKSAHWNRCIKGKSKIYPQSASIIYEEA